MSEGDADVDGAEDVWARSTAPQSPYTGREVGIGFVVLIAGLAVAFVLPLVVA